MLYLHYDAITTALLPYFITLVYFAIAIWGVHPIDKSVTSQSTNVYPEQVFQLLDETPSPESKRQIDVLISQPSFVDSHQPTIKPQAKRGRKPKSLAGLIHQEVRVAA